MFGHFSPKGKEASREELVVVAAVGKSLPTVQGALNRLFETSFTRLLPDNTELLPTSQLVQHCSVNSFFVVVW